MKSMKNFLCLFVLFLIIARSFTSSIKAEKKEKEIERKKETNKSLHKKLRKAVNTLSFLALKNDEEFISELGVSTIKNENENENEENFDLFGSNNKNKETRTSKKF
jgi:hypothetical protein